MIFLFYEIHRPQTIFQLVISLFLNSFLIYLIWNHTKSNLGATYKQLLTYQAAYNIFYSFCLFAMNPALHSSGEHYYFVVFCDSYLAPFIPKQFRYYFSGAVCAVYGGSFILLKIHFVYRYVQICNVNKYGYTFDALYWKLFWFVYQMGQVTIWFLGILYFLPMNKEKTELLRRTLPAEYRLDVDELGYTGMFYRTERNGTSLISWNDFYGMAMVLVINGFNCSCMLIFGYLTYNGLQTTVMSKKTRRLQTQLFHSLVVLTVLPLVMVYMPELVLLIGPVFGFGIESMGMLNELLIATVPAIDPIVLIYFIGDYRRAVQSIFCKRLRMGNISQQQYSASDTTHSRPQTNFSNMKQHTVILEIPSKI